MFSPTATVPFAAEDEEYDSAADSEEEDSLADEDEDSTEDEDSADDEDSETATEDEDSANDEISSLGNAGGVTSTSSSEIDADGSGSLEASGLLSTIGEVASELDAFSGADAEDDAPMESTSSGIRDFSVSNGLNSFDAGVQPAKKTRINARTYA